jgi:hypothetical protein
MAVIYVCAEPTSRLAQRAWKRRFWHHLPMLGHGISPPAEGHFPSLGGANEWLNSPPLSADGLRGKIVVVNFCTYTCINWRRAPASSGSRTPPRSRSRCRSRSDTRRASRGAPGTYLGYARTMDFASPGGLTRDEPRLYEAPQKLRRNHWSLSGDWTAHAEAVALNEAGGRIAFDVHARDVHLVMARRSVRLLCGSA